MKKKLLSLSVVGIMVLALASGAYASAVLDTVNGGSYHFTWGTSGIVDHVYSMQGTSIVPGNWDESWTINNLNLGTDWSITVAGESTIDSISVWQNPETERTSFNLILDSTIVTWSSTNDSGPFQGTVENLLIGAGTHTIGITAGNDDGGAFAQFSSTTPPGGPGSCVWNLQGDDDDVDALDLVVAKSDPTFNIIPFALEFGRINCQ